MPRKKIKQKPFIKYGLMALAAHLKLNMKKTTTKLPYCHFIKFTQSSL
jgi:hypothetical protein